MPMGNPEQDRKEAHQVRNRDALERMLNEANASSDLVELIDDLKYASHRAAELLALLHVLAQLKAERPKVAGLPFSRDSLEGSIRCIETLMESRSLSGR